MDFLLWTIAVPFWLAIAGPILCVILIVRARNRAAAEASMARMWRDLMDGMERSHEERVRQLETFERQVDAIQAEHIKRMEEANAQAAEVVRARGFAPHPKLHRSAEVDWGLSQGREV